MTIDAVIPARDEELTVALNVAAAGSCRHVRDVIVVDDGSRDATAAVARAAGARVVVRSAPGAPGSKALAASSFWTSSAVSSRSAAFRLSSSCSIERAPKMTEVTVGFASSQARATADGVVCLSVAMARRVSSVLQPRSLS